MKQFAKTFFAVWIVLAFAMPTFAHGVRINHTIDEATGEITVMAAFDTGEVLDEAAVIIFAPDDLINPWSTGVMDETGSYTFIPDYTLEGFWDIQVRKAGHGGLINIEISQDMMPEDPPEDDITASEDDTQTSLTMSDGSQIVITGDAQFQVTGDIVISATGTIEEANTNTTQVANPLGNGFTTAQIIIMSVSVIWGFIGTALFFARRKPDAVAP